MGRVRVMIAGAARDRTNTNSALREYVAEGFKEVLGQEFVGNVPFEIAAEQLRIARPDLLLVVGSCLPDQCEYSAFRGACNDLGCPLAFWLHEDPYEFDAAAKIVRLADYIFSNDRWAAEHYHRDNVWHMPLAASPIAHTRLLHGPGGPGAGRMDVFFCGTAYPSRVRMMKDLRFTLDRVHTEVWGDGWGDCELAFCKNERLPYGRLPEYYATSAVVLNLGRDFHYANRKYHLAPSTPGPRTFEAAMAGACQLIFADSLEVLDYFRADEEIVLFNDPQEFDALLTELLEQPEKAARIGVAARARCIEEHTYAARARQILKKVGIEAPVIESSVQCYAFAEADLASSH
jgi:spore maturation protein CgeB